MLFIIMNNDVKFTHSHPKKKHTHTLTHRVRERERGENTQPSMSGDEREVRVGEPKTIYCSASPLLPLQESPLTKK